MPVMDLIFQADTKKAVRGVNKFTKQASASFSAFKGVAAAAIGVFAGVKIARGIGNLVDAAAAQEDAINSLNSAIIASGRAIDTVEFQKFASGLQEITRFGDEVTLESAALIQSLGQLEQEGLEGATKAAQDMAAALKIDLKSAAVLVGKAATGEIGTLSRYGLVVKRGATNAETFANVLDTVNEKFGGAAARDVQTYSGAVEQLQNTYGDLNEELGFSITRNPVVTKTIGILNKAFLTISKAIKGNQKIIGDFVTKVLVSIVNFVPKVLKSFQFVIKGFQGIALAATVGKAIIADFLLVFLEFDLAGTVVNLLADAFRVLENTVHSTLSSVLNLISKIPGASSVFEQFGFDIDELKNGFKAMGDEAADSIGDDVTANLRSNLEEIRDSGLEAGEEVNSIFDPIMKGFNAVIGIVEDAADEIADAADSIDGSSDQISGAMDGITGGGGKKTTFFDDFSAAFSASVAGGFEEGSDAAATQKTLAPWGKALGAVFTDGAKAAGKAATEIFAVAIDTFLPGVGQALKPLFDAAQQDPEIIKQQVQAFAKGLVEAVPAIVEGLAAGAGEIVEALIDSLLTQGGLIRIVVALVEAGPRIAIAIVRGFIDGVSRFRWKAIEEVVKRFINTKPQWIVDLQEWSDEFVAKLKITTPAWVTQFANTMANIANFMASTTRPLTSALVSLTSWVTWLGNIMQNTGDTLSGRGQIGGTAGSIFEKGKSALGLADGGVVPAGFPNDSFAAGLTSGEAVIDRNTTEKLSAFLDGERRRMVNVMLQLNEETLAETIVNLDR